MVLYVLELSNSDIYLSLFILYSEKNLKEYFLDEFIIWKWQVYAWETTNKLLILCSLPNGMFYHLCLFVSLCCGSTESYVHHTGQASWVGH